MLAGNAGQPGKQADAGARVQLPPATNNKIPVVYGTAFIAPVIIDAKISEDQKTMWYVCALAEKTDTGTISFGDIYWGGKKVTFDGTDLTKVVSWETNSNPPQYETKVDGNLYIYLYNNGSSSGVNTANSAVAVMNDAGIALGERWPSTNTMNNCAFMIVRMKYNQDAGMTQLDQLTVQLTNSLKSPGAVIKDYMSNTVYGCAIDPNNIDNASLDVLDAYAGTPLPFYLYPYTGATSVQPRYEINGPINTGNDCLTNLQQLIDTCDCWLQYSEISGKWKVVVNRSYLDYTDLNSLYEVNDSNLIGGIDINPIDLNSSYNSVEVQYPNTNIKDQTDYQLIDLSVTAPTLLSPNEPDNRLVLQLPQVNSAVQALYLGARKLYQAREDLVVSFTLDYSGIQIEAGDVIRINFAIYGWTDKLFRVSQVLEAKVEDGSLGARIIAFEYNDTVYNQDVIRDYVPEANTGLVDPSIISVPGIPLISAVNTVSSVPSYTITSATPLFGATTQMEFWYAIAPTISPPEDTSTFKLWETQFYNSGPTFPPNTDVSTVISGMPPSGAGNSYYWRVRAVGVRTKSIFTANGIPFDWVPSPTATIVGQNFQSSFQPSPITVGLFANGQPDLANVTINLYGLVGAAQADFSNTQSNTTLANSQWRIDNANITATGITVGTPVESLDGIYATWPAPTAMTANVATLSVPIIYKDDTGVVYASPSAQVNINKLIPGTRGIVALAYVPVTYDPTGASDATLSASFAVTTGYATPIKDDGALFYNTTTNVTSGRKYNGSTWIVATLQVPGSAITANSITGTSLVANTITGNKISANTITSNHIGTGTLTADRITAGTITTNLMTANTINASVILSGTVRSHHMAAGTINADRLIAGSITTNLMEAGTIDADRITAGTITTSLMTANTINASVITSGSIKSFHMSANTINANVLTSGSITTNLMTANTIHGNVVTINTLAGNVLIPGTVNGNVIIANTVEGNVIKANTLYGNSIIANTINGNSIIANTIHGNAITANTINGNSIIANTIHGNAITANTISGNAITANTIDGSKIQAFTLTSGQIQAGSITASSIAANTITYENLVIGAVSQSRSQTSAPQILPQPFYNWSGTSNWPNNTRCIVPSGGVTITPTTDPRSSANVEYVEGSRIEVGFSARFYTGSSQASNLIEIWKSGASSVYDRGFNTIRHAYDLSDGKSSMGATVHAMGYGGLDYRSTNGGLTWSVYSAGSTQSTITGALNYYTDANRDVISTKAFGPLQAGDAFVSTGYVNYGQRNQQNNIFFDQVTTVDGVNTRESFNAAEVGPWTGGLGAGIDTGGSFTTAAFLAGNAGKIFFDGNGISSGTNWVIETTGTLQDLYSLYTNRATASSPYNYTAIACGSTGTIVKSSRTWSASSFAWSARGITGLNGLPLATSLYGVAGDDTVQSGTSKWVAVGEYAVIVTSSNDGETWTQRPTPVPDNLNAVRYCNGTWVAVGDNGVILTSTNLTTWTQINIGLTTRNLFSIDYNPQFNTINISGEGIILYTTKAAMNFTAVLTIAPAITGDMTRLTWYGSNYLVTDNTPGPIEQQILNNQVFSGTVIDTAFVAGQPTTYYLVIGNMAGSVVKAGQTFLSVTEVKR